MSFTERLIRAAAHKGVITPHADINTWGARSAIARFLGISRANLTYWTSRGGAPSAETYRLIADRLGVNRDWLETGRGEMVGTTAAPELPELKELSRIYLKATPSVRSQIMRTARALAKAMLVMGPMLPPLLADGPIEHNKNMFAKPLNIVHIACQLFLRLAALHRHAPLPGLTVLN